MEYRRLGKSGLPVSVLSYGSWVTFSHQQAVDTALESMSIAYDAGVNFFDNAEVYAGGESETIMGEVLKKAGWSRDSYLVSSKVYWGYKSDPLPTQRGLSRKHIYEACHQAMARLQVDYLDLYFCHRPDPTVPTEEIVRTMTDLINQGKVFYWGTSQWPADLITEAYGIARLYNLIPPTMEQPLYNMFSRDRVERDYARLYETIGLGTTIFSPLASGVLTGKYNDGFPSDSRAKLEGYDWIRQHIESEEGQAELAKTRQLSKLAGEMGTTVTRLALAWCAKNPQVSTVITGASRPSQVTDNLQALELLPQLTDDVMAQIETILDNKPEPFETY